MARHLTIRQAANYYGCHNKTVARWIDQGHVTGYRADPRTILVDLDEIEAAFADGHILDPRRPRFGEKARIIPLPSATSVRAPVRVPTLAEERAE